MAGYVIADIDVTDPVAYQGYVKLTPDIIAKYGGKFLVRGGATEVVEGTWSPNRLVVLEFESLEQAKKFYDSDEYRPVKAIRHKTAISNMVIVEGA
jgi:uncharacterized protein (DUF1330 family)